MITTLCMDSVMKIKTVSVKLDAMATSVISWFVIKHRVEGTEAVCALVLKGKMAVSAILLFALLQAAIMDNALVPIRARAILDILAAPAIVLLFAILQAAIMDNALVPISARVILDTVASSVILLFALLQAAIMDHALMDHALVQISARVILHTVVAPAMVSAILLHAAITDHALVPISARAILDTLIISAIPSTVRYAIMEESVIMLERIRIVIHVAMVVKARFAIFL